MKAAYFFHARHLENSMQKTNYRFRKINKLKTKRSFQYAHSKGHAIVDGMSVFYVLDNQGDSLKIGLAVGKKLGCAVVRNHTKRLMREVFRKHLAELKKGYHIVWVARNRLAKADYKTFERVFLRLAKKAKLLDDRTRI